MRLRLISLIAGISILFTFIQCKDSVTQTAETDTNLNSNPKTELTQPTLIAPETNSEQSTSPIFEWEEIDEVELFQVQLSIDENFNSTTVDSIVESTTFSIKDLPDDTTIYWQVRSVVENEEGPWSEVWNFTTAPNTSDSGPISTDLKAPGDGTEVKPDDLVLQWQEIENASVYNLQLADDQNFESLLVDREIDATSYQTSDLDNEEDYYWRVKPVITDKATEWSEVYEFTTDSQAETTPNATLISPEDGAQDQSTAPSLKWEEITGVENYQVQLATSDAFSSPVKDETVSNTTYDVSGLDNNQTYYWRVQADGDENAENWSATHEFTTEVETEPENQITSRATLLSPEDGVQDQSTTLSLKWEEIAGVENYQVQLATSDAFFSPVKDETVSNTTYDVSGLDNNQTYYWRVQADGDGNDESWSETYKFDTEAEPVPPAKLVSPEDNSTNQSITLDLSWEEISGIESYRVQLATSDDFISSEIDEMVSNTSYEASGLENDQTYFWRVQADGDGNTENWSSIRSFNTESEPINNSGDSPSSVEGDRQALMDLYEATSGDSWKNNSGWGSGNPSDSWYGIETDAEGRVTRVDLFDNGLNGQLPESIGNLSKVKYLNVKKNYLSGEIPSTIGNMASLEWLILSGRTYEIGGTLKEPPENLNYAYHPGKKRSATNNLNGTIPSTIGNLSNLLFLEISDQPNIKGPIPSELGNLSKLKGLYLNLNDFSGYSIPSSIGNLTNLKHLYMAAAQLEGEFPASLKNLTGLTNLNFGKPKNNLPANNLSGNLPDFSRFTELRSIILTNNNFDGEYPSYWNNGNFTKLHTLRITWNNLTGTLHGFDNLPALESFGVEGNRLSGTIEDQLTELPDRLQILGLGWNNFTGNLPQNGWADFYKLKTLYINDNDLSGGIPCDFWNKIDNQKLGIAWMKNNEFGSNCTSSMNSVEGNGNPDISVGGNNF